MANQKISAMTAAAAPTGTELTPLVQAGANVAASQYVTQPSGDASLNLATTAFVTAAIQPLNPASSVLEATTTVLPNTPTYNNGTAGVGATLTSAANAALSIDSTVTILNGRYLVKNQASAFQNGIYTLTQVGTGSVPWILTRATDYNSPQNINYTGTVPIIAGTTNAGTNWLLVSTIAAVGSPNSITYASQATPAKGTVTTNIGALGVNEIILGNGGFTVTASASIPSSITATTQTAGDNSTKVATTAYADASAKAAVAPGAIYSVPALGTFTAINAGTSSTAQTVSGQAIQYQLQLTSGLNWRIWTQATPATPYRVRVQLAALLAQVATQNIGLYFYDGTKLYGIELTSQGNGNASGFRVEKITNVTTDNATVTFYGSSAYVQPSIVSPTWFQIRSDGTTLNFDISMDGQNFINVWGEAVGTFMTPTAYGFGGINAGTGNHQYSATILNWITAATASIN